VIWNVRVHDRAAKQLKAIPPDRRKRILNDIDELAADPFRGLIRPLVGKEYKGIYRKVSGRYRIIFKPIHATHTIEVSMVLLRNEATYDKDIGDDRFYVSSNICFTTDIKKTRTSRIPSSRFAIRVLGQVLAHVVTFLAPS
jgi:mRNA-degrading endonuclease RelE of RelBE toxin-antitoxin system